MKRTHRIPNQNIVPLVSFIVFSISMPLWAQSPEEEEMFGLTSEAVTLYGEGNFQQAVEKFKEAYALVSDANILFNIARCYQLMGEDEEAIKYYDLFVRRYDVSEKDKDKARAYLLVLQQKKMNDKGQGTPSAEDSQAVSEPEFESASESTQAEPVKRKRILEWSLVGGGGAALIVGGIFGGLSIEKHNHFESTTVLDSKLNYKDQGEAYAIVTDVCLAVGVAAVATGIVLLFVLDDQEEKEQETHNISYAPFFTRDGGGAAFNLSF